MDQHAHTTLMEDEVETPSSKRASPQAAAPSQSNYMTSPKSSIRSPIRSRRSRRNRAANRRNRGDGATGAQEGSSPSMTSQSQTFTNRDDHSLLLGSQYPESNPNEKQAVHRFHSRKPAQQSMNLECGGFDLQRHRPLRIDPSGQSQGLASFYGQ